MATSSPSDQVQMPQPDLSVRLAHFQDAFGTLSADNLAKDAYIVQLVQRNAELELELAALRDRFVPDEPPAQKKKGKSSGGDPR